MKYVRDIPIDYDGEMYVPTSILMLPMLYKWFDVVRFAHEPVRVNGKMRFYRVVIKRKVDVTADDILKDKERRE